MTGNQQSNVQDFVMAGNPNPTRPAAFVAAQFKPVSELPKEKLARQALAVKVPVSVDALVRQLPQKERIEWLRWVICEAAIAELSEQVRETPEATARERS